MKRERGIQPILDDWLREGPVEAPDRVVDVVADRVTRESQRPPWVFLWRSMPAAALIAAAGIAAVLAVGVGLGLAGRPSDPSVGLPPATPVPSPSSTPSPTSNHGPPSNPDRQACLEGYAGCLGPLAAGAHTATQFGVDFTVPAGWTNPVDTGDWLLLGPQGATSPEWIALFRDAVISGQNAECTPQPRPELGHTVGDIVSYLTHHPGLVTSPPEPTSIGGLSGTSLDVSLAPSWRQSCPFNGAFTVMYMTQDRAHPGYFWVVDPTEHQRMAFLDDGTGGVIVVAINSASAAGFDALVRAATPIVDTLTFRPRERAPSVSPSP